MTTTAIFHGRDDNLLGICPDCGGTHDHQPFEEAGTNERGVTVTATQGLSPTDEVLAADPYVHTGIHEAEIATIHAGKSVKQTETKKEVIHEETHSTV